MTHSYLVNAVIDEEALVCILEKYCVHVLGQKQLDFPYTLIIPDISSLVISEMIHPSLILTAGSISDENMMQ